MTTDLLRKAVLAYETCQDPLLLDAIRALSDPNTPPAVRKTVETYVRVTWNQYLTLMWNSGKSLPYGYDHDISDDGAEVQRDSD